MKYFIALAIVLCMSVFSCETAFTDYQFSKINGTNNLKYKAGEIEGAIFQDKIENGHWVERPGFKIFNGKDYSILEKHLNDFDKIITAWFQEDFSNPFVKGWLSNSFLKKQLTEYFDLIGKQNINRLKRLYVFETDKSFSGKVKCRVYLTGDNQNWDNEYPKFSFGDVTNGYLFSFTVKENTITLELIVALRLDTILM